MTNTRKKFSPGLKTKVCMELMRGEQTVAQICSRYGVHPTQANQWKRQALSALQSAFEKPGRDVSRRNELLIEELYKNIGQLTVELDWLKKKLNLA